MRLLAAGSLCGAETEKRSLRLPLLLPADLDLSPVSLRRSSGLKVQLMQVRAIKMITVTVVCEGAASLLRAVLTLVSRGKAAKKKRQKTRVFTCRLAGTG